MHSESLSPAPILLPEYESDRYWAIWQYPENRYSYSITSSEESWLMVLDNPEAGEACLASDARTNGRSLSDYRLDELTIPEAFAAVRAQVLPFFSSFGRPVYRVCGIILIAQGEHGWVTIRNIRV